VLASGSPQRRALLAALGLEFEVVVPEVEEERDGDPGQIVVENARRKARAVANTRHPRWRTTDSDPAEPHGGDAVMILAGDTEVVLDRRALGQPAGEGEARAHLEALAGRSHVVLGAIAILRSSGEERTGTASSEVTFRDLDKAMIGAYLASGEWRGRAGSYAVQGLGSALVERVEGDLSNVIGLPIPVLVGLAPELFEAGS
jgi:septum formation protein